MGYEWENGAMEMFGQSIFLIEHNTENFPFVHIQQQHQLNLRNLFKCPHFFLLYL